MTFESVKTRVSYFQLQSLAISGMLKLDSILLIHA